MDQIWKAAGMDLQLTTYRCISVSHMTGLIEVIPNAETIASITQAAGGAMAAFRDDPITSWLQMHNPDKVSTRPVHSRFRSFLKDYLFKLSCVQL